MGTCGPRGAALVVLVGMCAGARAQGVETPKEMLPDAPSALLRQSSGGEAGDGTSAGPVTRPVVLRPCKDSDYVMQNVPLQGPPPCIPENPISPYVTSAHVEPLSSKQKATLAMRDFLDPFNFVTIAGYSAIAVAHDSHTAYGAGFKGFAKLSGYGLVEDAQGEFFETYAIPSLLHEDPRYHRMPTASAKRRVWHAVRHTFVSEHDDGTGMPNYATLATYVISAELSNLYVPGLQTDAKSTAQRIAIGIGTDPAGAIVAEFLPDVARHIHINVRFIQSIVNAMATGAPSVAAE